MTNDRGYPDAIQLRFRDSPNLGAYTIIQCYAEASQITLNELKEVRETSIRETENRIRQNEQQLQQADESGDRGRCR